MRRERDGISALGSDDHRPRPSRESQHVQALSEISKLAWMWLEAGCRQTGTMQAISVWNFGRRCLQAIGRSIPGDGARPKCRALSSRRWGQMCATQVTCHTSPLSLESKLRQLRHQKLGNIL